MTNPPHIIQSAIDGETYDLTKNRIRFDLLPADVQETLRTWPHGFLYWWDKDWHEVDQIRYVDDNVYRAKPAPAPKTAEHVLWWHEGDDASFRKFPRDTHRLTIRHTGDTLPYGTYAGPDGATITVEKAE
jgi:hypothetical protein